MNRVGFGQSSFALKATGFTNKANSDDAILALFAGGKQGVWYDPSDKSTLFQDVAGTVPATKDGDPVALMRDKSGNGNHAKQTVTTARAVYKTDGILHWLAFDGVDDYFVTTVKQYADFSYYTAASSFYNPSLQVIMGGRSGVNNRSHIGHQAGSVAAGVGTLQGGSLQIVEQFTQGSVVLGSLVYDANTVGLRQNKTKTFQVNLSGTPLPPQDNFVGALSTSGTPSSYLKGSIYGIIAINSAEHKEDVTSYLAKKSGVTL